MTENTRVLVVDDEKKICEDLKAYLTYHGHEVEIALGGEEGLEKLKSFRPHVVLLDVRMPGISGLEALARMREFDPSVRITMVTAVHEESVAKMDCQTW